jgi:hypothetical protein
MSPRQRLNVYDDAVPRTNDMSEIYRSRCAHGANRSKTADAASRRASDWLCLGAAPTFAIMALLTGVFSGGDPKILCSPAEHASPLSGMVFMYVLMSTFHLAPWFRLISKRRRADRV